MKISFVISSLIICCLALLNPIAPFINYRINKAKIIEKFCENKEIPELKCEGKCHLKKLLIKTAKAIKSEGKSFSKTAAYPIARIYQLKIKTIKTYSNRKDIKSLEINLRDDSIKRIDHPPQKV
jgi:hypothetical protein